MRIIELIIILHYRS